MATARTKPFKSKTIQEWSGGERVPNLPEIPIEKWVEARINKGIVTTIDSPDIPDQAIQSGLNIHVRYDKTSRRFGLIPFGPGAPDDNIVLKVFGFKLPDGTGHTLRFTPTSIYALRNAETQWDEITGTLLGGSGDFFNPVVLFNRLVFSNNGANPVQEADLTTDTFGDLGNAPPLRFITGFFNRVVGAAIKEDNEILVQWSAEYPNIQEWDPAINETAGSFPLVDSPDDTGDHIKGIFAITNNLIIMREKSVWVGTKQAVPTNPFHLYSLIPGIGCDLPRTIIVRGNGLVWADFRTKMVYSWEIGGQLDRISTQVTNVIFEGIGDTRNMFGSFDPIEDEYSMSQPLPGTSIVPTWTYNFRTGAWSYNEFLNLSSDDSLELLTGKLTINELRGTINELQGTIDGLSPVSAPVPTRILGTRNGNLLTFDPTSDSDADFTSSIPSSHEYETQITSKQLVIPTDNVYISKIIVSIIPNLDTNLQLWYSLDGGDSEDWWRLAKTKEFTGDLIGKRVILSFRKVVRTRKFAWRVTSENGQFDLIGFEVWVSPDGEQSSATQTR